MVEKWGGIVFVACRVAPTPGEEKAEEAGGGGGDGGAGGGDITVQEGIDDSVSGRILGGGGVGEGRRSGQGGGCAAGARDLEVAAALLHDAGLDDTTAIVAARGTWASKRAAHGGGIVWLTRGEAEGRGYPSGREMTGREIGAWARQMVALQEVVGAGSGGRGDGGGVAACDACRATLEAMNLQWGAVAGALVRQGAVEIVRGGAGAAVADLRQGKDASAAAVDAMESVCTAPGRMGNEASDQVRRACASIARLRAKPTAC